MQTQKTFFEVYEDIRIQAIDELIQELQIKRKWKMLRELKLMREDLISSKMTL
jgi:hypothetical protein